MEEWAHSEPDFSRFEHIASPFPQGPQIAFHSCPEFTSTYSSNFSNEVNWNSSFPNLAFDASPHMACGRPNELMDQPFQEGTRLSNEVNWNSSFPNVSFDASLHMACGKPNELMNRLLQKYDQPVQEGTRLSNEVNWTNVSFDSSPHMVCGRSNELMNRLMYKQDQPSQEGTLPETLPNTMLSTSIHKENAASQHRDASQGDGESNGDFFDRLVKITEGCAANGDPFDPVPLP
jgi:hypothetical protein